MSTWRLRLAPPTRRSCGSYCGWRNEPDRSAAVAFVQAFARRAPNLSCMRLRYTPSLVLPVLVLGAMQAVAQNDTSVFAPLALPSPTAVRTASGAPGARYWQNRADYASTGRRALPMRYGRRS